MESRHKRHPGTASTAQPINAFYGTDLDLELRRRKVTGIVLAGISTSIGVESTARAANERGYELTIVTDAVTDPDEGAHLNSLRAIFPRIAELATTAQVLTALDRVRPVELQAGPGG